MVVLAMFQGEILCELWPYKGRSSLWLIVPQTSQSGDSRRWSPVGFPEHPNVRLCTSCIGVSEILPCLFSYYFNLSLCLSFDDWDSVSCDQKPLTKTMEIGFSQDNGSFLLKLQNTEKHPLFFTFHWKSPQAFTRNWGGGRALRAVDTFMM